MLKWLKPRPEALKGYVTASAALVRLEATLSWPNSFARAERVERTGEKNAFDAPSDKQKAEVLAQVREYLGRSGHEDVSAPVTAIRESGWDILRGVLLEGILPSYIESKAGKMVAIDPRFWSDEASIQVLETKKVSGGVAEYHLSGQVVVPQKELDQLIARVTQFKSQSKPVASSLRKGGAPAKYDTEAFLIEAFCILYDNVPTPKTEAELRRRALDAYVEAGHPGGTPSDDWARPRIRSLWKRLSLGATEL